MAAKKLLIADDEPALRALVAATLRSETYEILQVSDGLQALEVVQRERPDLVLLDVIMPGMDGFEVCRRIKGDPELSATTVVMLTVRDQQADRERGQAAGATAYLTKPFSPLQLLELVEQVMQPEAASSRASRDVVLQQVSPPPGGPALAAFMFADIRGFTSFTLKQGDRAAYDLVQEFQRLVKQYTGIYGSRKVNTAGDNVLLVFPTAHQAVLAAAALQAAIRENNAANPGHSLAVGIGLDVGEPVEAEGDFIGASLNRAARVTGEAAPGEILVTATVRHLARDATHVTFLDRGLHPLRGFDEPQQLYRVVSSAEGITVPEVVPADFGKLRTLLPRRRLALLAAAASLMGLMAVALLRPMLMVREPIPTNPSATTSQTGVPGPSLKSLTQVVSEARTFTVLIASKTRAGAGLGSGVIYDSKGLIVTNAHVVEGAESVEVHLANGASVTAQVLGRSAQPDLAVLQIPGGPYPFGVFADSDRVQVGEEVVALGFPAAFSLGAQASPTRGIISQAPSALGGQYFQIDASFNPGLSGGPLLNGSGAVIGVNVGRIENVGGRPIEGIGFAIPSNLVKEGLSQLEAGRQDLRSAPRPPTLLSPAEVVAHFHRLIHAGEFGLAYALVSDRLKGSVPVEEFATAYGYRGKVGVQLMGSAVVSQTDTMAEVAITVLVSELIGDQVKSTWYDQRWQVVRQREEWRLDNLVRNVPGGP